MEVRTRFKGLDLIDRVPDELWNEVRDIVQETGIKTIPMEKKYSLGICNFLEEISSLSHSVVFLYFFALIAEEAFLSLLAILWNSAFRCLYISISPLLFTSLFTAICKASSDSHFAFLLFFSMGMVLIPVSCTMSRTSFHSSSGTLSDLAP